VTAPVDTPPGRMAVVTDPAGAALLIVAPAEIPEQPARPRRMRHRSRHFCPNDRSGDTIVVGDVFIRPAEIGGAVTRYAAVDEVRWAQSRPRRGELDGDRVDLEFHPEESG